MSLYREVGEAFVAEAKPGWTDVKKDIERAGGAVVAAYKSGRVPQDVAQAVWLDRDLALSVPMQRRYLEEGALEAVTAFQRRRATFGSRGWMDESAWTVIDGLVAHGRGSDAVALVREHFDRRLKLLRKHVQLRYRRGPRRQSDEDMKAAIDALAQAIVDDIPGEKAELIRDLQQVTALIREHGGDDDHRWFAAVVTEIWRERR